MNSLKTVTINRPDLFIDTPTPTTQSAQISSLKITNASNYQC